MPADEIGEAFFRVVFRYVVSFVADILWNLICFYIGFPVVTLVSLNIYPERKATVAQEMITSTGGFLILLFGTAPRPLICTVPVGQYAPENF